MPNAVKAKDLQRDPRCCLITSLADRNDLAGEVKAFCRAQEVVDHGEWEAVRAGFRELIGSDVVGDLGDAHLFELDIEAAAWQRVDEDRWLTTSWQVGEPTRERSRT